METAECCDSPPWEKIEGDFLCLLCTYNLRGLTSPRCPECGYRFEWEEMLDPQRRLHPFIFEHHPERNVGSFVKTAVAGFRVSKFWQTLHPTQPSNLWRLVVYFILTAVFPLLLAMMLVGMATYYSHQEWESNRQWCGAFISRLQQTGPLEAGSIMAGHNSIQQYVNSRYPPMPWYSHTWRGISGRDTSTYLLLPLAVMMTWPWLTLGALQIFQLSMRRARIASIHVLRCVIYSFDFVLWAAMLLSILLAVGLYFAGAYAIPMFISIAYIVYATSILLSIHRLVLAYRWYLRMGRPFATVLASQFIVALLMLNLVAIVTIWRW